MRPPADRGPAATWRSSLRINPGSMLPPRLRRLLIVCCLAAPLLPPLLDAIPGLLWQNRAPHRLAAIVLGIVAFGMGAVSTAYPDWFGADRRWLARIGWRADRPLPHHNGLPRRGDLPLLAAVLLAAIVLGYALEIVVVLLLSRLLMRLTIAAGSVSEFGGLLMPLGALLCLLAVSEAATVGPPLLVVTAIEAALLPRRNTRLGESVAAEWVGPTAHPEALLVKDGNRSRATTRADVAARGWPWRLQRPPQPTIDSPMLWAFWAGVFGLVGYGFAAMAVSTALEKIGHTGPPTREAVLRSDINGWAMLALPLMFSLFLIIWRGETGGVIAGWRLRGSVPRMQPGPPVAWWLPACWAALLIGSYAFGLWLLPPAWMMVPFGLAAATCFWLLSVPPDAARLHLTGRGDLRNRTYDAPVQKGTA